MGFGFWPIGSEWKVEGGKYIRFGKIFNKEAINCN